VNRNALRAASALIVSVICATTCLANNNLFLPGDAFFPTALTKADIESLAAAKTGERTFAYSSFGGYMPAFCGYAGYAYATIPAVDDELAKNLVLVYGRIRERDGQGGNEPVVDGDTKPEETTGIRVLFYSRDFEFPRHALGLRYNENWVAETVKFGHRKEDVRLCCLISDPEALERSWRDAEEVAALNVDLPDVPLKPVPLTEAPVVVRGPVKAIVIGSHSLQELFRPDEDDELTVYMVDSKGITRLDHRDGQWREPGTE